MHKAEIAAIEYFLPPLQRTNEDLAALFPQWTGAQIFAKTGIRIRHLSAEGQTAADLAVLAAEKVLSSGRVARDEIDFLIFCTQYSDYLLPATSCVLQHRLGLSRSVGTVDVNQGCSGFVYGLALASGLIEASIARNVLLLTADTYSKLIGPQDKALMSLFSDGAAATIIRAASQDRGAPSLGPFVLGTDGSAAHQLMVPDGGARRPLGSTDTGGTPPRMCIHMDGPAIFTFTLSRIPPLVKELCQKSGVMINAIDWFVFHQANRFMLEALRSQLGLPTERFVIDLEEVGNTISSSIPIAIKRLYSARDIRAPACAMLVGFGTGLSWGAVMATLPSDL